MRLLLLRHGQTPANVLGQLDTAIPGAPLTPLGQAQARAAVAGLTAYLEAEQHHRADDRHRPADHSRRSNNSRPSGQTHPADQQYLPADRHPAPDAAPPPPAIDALFVSTLLRTQLTAAPLAAARGLTPTVLDGLREITAGSLEMRDDHHSQGVYNATAFRWASGDLDLRMPGGENGHEFFARFDAAIATVAAAADGTTTAFAATASAATAASGSAPAADGAPATDGAARLHTVVAVSHGAAIRTWVAARAQHLDGSFANTHSLDNTGLALLDGSPTRGWRLLDWHHDPIGGSALADPTAVDPTGETESVT